MRKENALALSLCRAITGLEARITIFKEKIIINYLHFSVMIMEKSSVHICTDVHCNYIQQYVYLSRKNEYSILNTKRPVWHFYNKFGLIALIMHAYLIVQIILRKG